MKIGSIMVAVFCFIMSSLIISCGKKQEALQESQEPLSVDVISTANILAEAKPESAAMPPQGPYKPTDEDIQIALKNAGFYDAEVDGKIGPKTKKAIEEFQKANNLQADGKVGPKTWAVLSAYLNPAPQPTGKKAR